MGRGKSDGINFIESNQAEIVIRNMSYEVFEQMMHFLYSGKIDLGAFIERQIRKSFGEDYFEGSVAGSTQRNLQQLNMAVDYLIDFLRVADEYLLDDLKSTC